MHAHTHMIWYPLLLFARIISSNRCVHTCELLSCVWLFCVYNHDLQFNFCVFHFHLFKIYRKRWWLLCAVPSLGLLGSPISTASSHERSFTGKTPSSASSFMNSLLAHYIKIKVSFFCLYLLFLGKMLSPRTRIFPDMPPVPPSTLFESVLNNTKFIYIFEPYLSWTLTSVFNIWFKKIFLLYEVFENVL